MQKYSEILDLTMNRSEVVRATKKLLIDALVLNSIFNPQIHVQKQVFYITALDD